MTRSPSPWILRDPTPKAALPVTPVTFYVIGLYGVLTVAGGMVRHGCLSTVAARLAPAPISPSLSPSPFPPRANLFNLLSASRCPPFVRTSSPSRFLLQPNFLWCRWSARETRCVQSPFDSEEKLAVRRNRGCHRYLLNNWWK